MTMLWPLQVALVERLTGYAPLAAMIGTRIYDGEAPANTEYPYIVIGEPTEVPRFTMGADGSSDTVTLHMVSAYAGNNEVLAMLGHVHSALYEPLTLTGHGAARLKREFFTVLLEQGLGVTLRHAPARYRITSWKAAA